MAETIRNNGIVLANTDLIFKIVALGDSGVGKTAVYRRYSDNEFHEHMVTTVGCDFITKTVRMGGKTIKLHLWDTGGQEKYRAIVPSYIRDTHAIFLCYAISDFTSFTHIDNWIKFAKDFGPSNAVRVLVGNKTDQRRIVSTKMGKALADKYGYLFFETSAKLSDNVEATFRAMTAKILETKSIVEAVEARMNDSSTARLGAKDNKKESGCCS